ncbi:hypothetical protein GH714_034059 [Hevea brasiliensis]|uniref:Uncharacterized protein n=1 Tax=Hevea brasiliensis TaxID=3981 RepID=A0A6A6KLT4_HEVBR|nr:hypothetical protein GH714_034059 [Hevea brasiliensis]
MVRSPCCEKGGLKKGPWTPEEDQKLLAYIEKHGHGSWQSLPAKAGLQRCGKSCRLRWTNYLRPDIKRGKFSLQEEQTIIQLHALIGNKWSAIATHLPKRTDNEIKNYWNTHLKKRLDKMGIDPVTHKPKVDAFGSGQSKDAAHLSHMAQWESARLEAEARLVRESKLTSNPLENQFGFSSPQLSANKAAVAAAAAAAPPVRPKCLDVLKAWQGMVSGMFFVSSDSLESPTSTLNFSEAVPVVGFHHESSMAIPPPLQFPACNITCKGGMNEDVSNSEYEWKCFEKSNQMAPQVKETLDGSIPVHEMSTYSTENAWVLDSFRAAANENASIVNIVEGLSDIIPYNSGEQNSSMAGENTATIASCGAGGNLEDLQGNYWNSLLLNLVDPPPSGSPVF